MDWTDIMKPPSIYDLLGHLAPRYRGPAASAVGHIKQVRLMVDPTDRWILSSKDPERGEVWVIRWTPEEEDQEMGAWICTPPSLGGFPTCIEWVEWTELEQLLPGAPDISEAI